MSGFPLDWFKFFLIENTLLIIESDTPSASFWTESIAMDNRSLPIRFTDFNELITMFPDKINQISFVYLTFSCFYCTDQEFVIF